MAEVKTNSGPKAGVCYLWPEPYAILIICILHASIIYGFLQVTSESLAEWGSRQAQLNEVGNFLIERTNPQTSRVLSEEIRRVNMHWAEFVHKNTFVSYS